MQLTEAQEKAIGEKLAKDLSFKRDKAHKDRFVTSYGSKTALGVYRTLKSQLDTLEREALQ